MTVKLLDDHRREIVVDVGDVENIARMIMNVYDGNEVLTVIYKNYEVKKFYSVRGCDGCCDEYDVYNMSCGRDLTNDETFVNRKTPYSW